MAFIACNKNSALPKIERRKQKMLINTTAANNSKKISLFEEDIYCELQKWERRASP